ncbi:hypothetical protein BOX37_07240 [Nocardia mangyaensis]|uniref:Uncharacterized protein n=1 Tax=Nocardia mangyaensis TaxID=2213200 RepID=A0A1J0VP88_9NOCA|nr:hypothetical protein [Nocardia mangyaensis]APE33799.1 hypothetical protein BOX37_07240 [Nocardia mangyaensis]
MFTLHDNNSGGHADGPAVEDELTRSTGKALGSIMAAARMWIHNQRGRKVGDTVPKLSRKERKELAETIQAQVGEQKVAAAWYSKRVDDYRFEVLAAHARRNEPGYTPADIDRDDARLAGIRYSIESTLHEQQSLPIERRGQVALALSEADRNPAQPHGAVFTPMNAEQERTARAVAVQSETWVAGRREHNARLVAEQREQAAKRAEARREQRPPRAYDELNDRQRNAVQRLRSAHLGVNRSGQTLDPEIAEQARQTTQEAAYAAGLSRREIGHEIDYMAEHTSYTATYGVPGGVQVRNHYPVREEAIEQTAREMGRDQRLSQDAAVFVAVESRPTGLAADDVQRRSAMGPRDEAISAVARWSREHEVEYAVAEPHEVAVARIEPGTGKVLSSEIATVGSEAAAMDYAHASVDSAASSAARMRVEVTDPREPGTPRYENYGLPKTLAADLADHRVGARERLLGEAELDQMDLAREHASLRQRHSLSIEHNGELTDRNADLTRQLATMIAERDQALADRDRFRGERDEAVHKLAERAPAKERFGSPERQAAAVRETSAPSRPAQERAAAPEPERPVRDVMITDLAPEVRQMLADEMLAAYENTDSPVVREQLARQGDSETLREGLDKFSGWWLTEGVVRYRAERQAEAGAAKDAERVAESAREASVPVFSGVAEQSSGVAASSGNALADALARQTERDGMER